MLTEEQFSRFIGAASRQMRGTLVHLVDGEEYALRRWRRESRHKIIAAISHSIYRRASEALGRAVFDVWSGSCASRYG